MKKIFLVCSAIFLLSGMIWGQTTINFDDADIWTAAEGTQLGSYSSGHSYTDGVFSATGGPALRETNGTQDDYPKVQGTYAWRLKNDLTVNWVITISSGGVSNFSIDIRRWDPSPSPNFNLDYSVDGGTIWTTVTTINNEALDGSSAWKTFNGIINSSNNNIKIRLKANGTTERIMVDNFVWNSYGSSQQAATPTFNPPAGLYESPQTITISCTTPGVTIRYTTDGTTPTETEGIIYTEPITLSVTTTLKAVAYGEGYSISPVAQALYIFPVNVSTIADLRAGTPGTYYKYSGTGVLTFQQTFRNQKFIQDNTAAILIDDLNGKITTTYNLYDGISNIIGTVNEYGGMMQLTPYSDPGPAVSTGNVIIPPEISLNELVTNFEQYESELVKVMGVYFDTADNVITFTNGTLYPMNSGLMNFRTTFYDVDYIGMVVPTGLWNIIGIPNSRVAEGNLFTARFWADFSSAEQPPLPVVLTSFTAIIAGENCVNISWITESENELLGYYIYRSTDDKLENAQRISEMIAANNSSSQYIYTYTDNEVFDATTYFYWLQSIELGGIATIYGPVSVYYSPMNDNPTPEVPFETALGPIYPNPFNPVVFIPYSLAEATDLNLYIYNSRGQLIRHFYVGTQEPGYYRLSWDGTDSKGTACSNGIYQIVMKTGKNVFSRKAALMK